MSSQAIDSDHSRIVWYGQDRSRGEAAREALRGIVSVSLVDEVRRVLAALAAPDTGVLLVDSDDPASAVELLRRVRHELHDVDVILAVADESAAAEALRTGASDVLRRPFAREELARAVRGAVARRRLASAHAALRDHVRTLEACAALGPCLEAGEVYAVGLDLLLSALSRARGVALFKRSDATMSDGVVFRGLSEAEARRLRPILLDEKPIDVGELAGVELATSGPFHDALRAAGIEAARVLAVAVHGGESEAGVLWLFEDERPYDAAELARAKTIRGRLEAALDNAERYNRAKERAFIDDVTELYNARYLHTAIDHELRRAERYGHAVSVLFLDVDRFKLVNDRHGHLVGSRALRQLGQVLAQCVRQVDTVARYGGDEFTIVLTDTDFEVACRIAERIRDTVAQASFDGGPSGALRLTVSVGVGAYPRHGRSREDLLDVADKAMYRAKSLGRNRVCTADDLSA
jgi:diguanylate cyclase (GGDEF)-like protein